ncbi:hypothetical protein HN51_005924 [Arachis hypogaea]|uniref:Uncharacterized protein n=2 Tax=Arachis TaxID=3817 RepID=A0A445DCR5_ARAHY|nr:uncharacterized protein LOC107485801 [Arachis duranensis]XP_025693019.1 uncharacterized protein LOC112795296 [Arachis hypogaea]XP_057756429.1 uncharacterized protein LOC130975697 [Arachis stenosperma]QHO39751.1 uncharacterized protein DS421_4g131860 [Arachis hypogaea]RYR60984.1 hypothetical protein Ahy_A04g018074 [Arachis hypogaea]
MAGRINSLVSSLPKFGHAGATIARARVWNPRVFAAVTPRPIQVPPHNKAEGTAPGTDGMTRQETTETVFNSMNDTTQQDKSYSTAEHVAHRAVDKAGEMANQVSQTAQNISEKAKQTMQEAWDTTKSTANRAAAHTITDKAKQTMQDAWASTRNSANRAADSVLEKAQDSADAVKENAEAIRRNIKKN